MFTNIVVGTDGSERAGRAVDRALGLASTSGATLHVVHAYQGTRPEIVDGARAIVERIATELEATGRTVTIRTHALLGDPADVVLDFAYDAGTDLIVVGNRGMTGRRGRILGSVPNAISHDATCAVMIIPTQGDGEGADAPSTVAESTPNGERMFQRIVVGTDGSERAGRAIEQAAELAARFEGTLHIVQAYKGVEETMATAMASGSMITPSPEMGDAAAEEADAIGGGLDSIAQQLRDRGIRVETHAVPGSPAPAILDAASSVGADLIVVGNRGMTGAKRILGSVPNTLSHHAECAILIVPTDD